MKLFVTQAKETYLEIEIPISRFLSYYYYLTIFKAMSQIHNYIIVCSLLQLLVELEINISFALILSLKSYFNHHHLLLVLWQIIENVMLVNHLMKAKEIC
jgi:hypothetical protein